MKKDNFIKKLILIIAGIVTIPALKKFEDTLSVDNQIIAAIAFTYSFIIAVILFSFIYDKPNFVVLSLLAVFCNSSAYAYTIYKQNK